MQFGHLNESEAQGGSDAYRRVLARLGDDVAAITQLLQLRPRSAERIAGAGPLILVRLTMPGEHVVLRIDPEGDLAGELFFARELARRAIPSPLVIQADLSRSRFPFAYLVETFVGGLRGDALEDDVQLHGIARQLGRACRQIHAIAVPGWGRPTLRRSWPTRSWAEALALLVDDATLALGGRILFGEELSQRIVASALAEDAPPAQPRLLHGALGPASMIVTPGEQARLAAIIEPGRIVGGDPLLDLAGVLDPAQPAAFREGFVNGYGLGSLSADAARRLRRLRLLDGYMTACRRYLLAEPHAPQVQLVHGLLAELDGDQHNGRG